jgi:hypothetical protein
VDLGVPLHVFVGKVPQRAKSRLKLNGFPVHGLGLTKNTQIGPHIAFSLCGYLSGLLQAGQQL